jgi:hypothetical protein
MSCSSKIYMAKDQIFFWFGKNNFGPLEGGSIDNKGAFKNTFERQGR